MPALIETAELPDDPGCTAYQITGCTHDDVQAAIHEICDTLVNGEAHFRNPQRAYSIHDGLKRWRARGFVRLTQCAEACADVRAWQRERAAR